MTLRPPPRPARLLALSPWALVWALSGHAQSQTPPTPPEAAASAPVQNSALDAPMFYQLLIGELEAQAGRLGNAHEVMLDAARRSKDEGLYRRAVELAFEARAGESALQAAKAWRQALPQSQEAARTLVQIVVALNKTAEAAEPLKHLLQLQPEAERASVIAAVPNFLSTLADKSKALVVADRALAPFEAAPATRTAALTARGRVALAAGEPEAALKLARLALGDEPGAPGPTLLALELMPKLPAAEVLVQSSLARADTPAPMRLAYARTLDGRQRLGEAATQLKLALAQQPSLAVAWLTLGAYQIELRETRDGVASLNRFLAAQAKPAAKEDEEGEAAGPHLAFLLLAQAHEQLKELDTAKQWLDRIAPADVDLSTLSRRASLLAAEGRLTEARALLRAAPAKGSPDARSRMLAEVQLLRERKQPQSAYDMLLDAMRQRPEDAVVIYELAMTADQLGRFEDMESLLRRVMSLKPDDYQALNAMGYALVERNQRLDEAQALLEQAQRLAPGDPFLIDSLGWLAFRKGQWPEAIRLLRQSHTARPHVEVAAHLGEALWVSGQRDEALQVWRDGQRREPDNAVLLETVKRLQAPL